MVYSKHMELTNTGENAMKNQIVKMTLTGIRTKNGKREEIAGCTGMKVLTKQEIADRQKWFDEIVESGEYDDHFTGYQVEYIKAHMEVTNYAVVTGGMA